MQSPIARRQNLRRRAPLSALFGGLACGGSAARQDCTDPALERWIAGRVRGAHRPAQRSRHGAGRFVEGCLGRVEELQARSRKCRAENPVQLMKRLDLRNLLLVSKMVCKAALHRTESRGAHFRSDCPEERNPEWLKNIRFRKEDGENMTLETVSTVR